MGEMSDYYRDLELLAPTPRQRRLSEKQKKELESNVKNPEYWHSRDGRLKPITDMDDKHLANAIAMLERQGARALPPTPRTASEEDTFIAITQLKMLGFSPLQFERYGNLLKERERREENEAIAEAEADDIDAAAG